MRANNQADKEVDVSKEGRNATGLRMPMLVSRVRETTDHRDERALAVDVVFHPWVLHSCRNEHHFQGQAREGIEPSNFMYHKCALWNRASIPPLQQFQAFIAGTVAHVCLASCRKIVVGLMLARTPWPKATAEGKYYARRAGDRALESRWCPSHRQ